MKRNTFMKRLAVTALAATMTFGTVPMTAVSALADNAVTSPAVDDSEKDTKQYAIDQALKTDAVKAVTVKSDSTKDVKAATKNDPAGDGQLTVLMNTINSQIQPVTEKGVENTYQISAITLNGKESDVAWNADEEHITAPVLRFSADVTKNGGEAAGSVEFTVDATELTAQEQVAAAKLIIENTGNTDDYDNYKYSNDDNGTSLKAAAKALLSNEKAWDGLTLAADPDGSTNPADLVDSVSVSSRTDATRSAQGSLSLNVSLKKDYYTTLENSNDTEAQKATASATASYTATIKKLDYNSDDDDYQTLVNRALANVTFTNQDFESEDDADAKKKVTDALENVGIREYADGSDISFRGLKEATHKANGSVTVLLDAKRGGENKTTEFYSAKCTVEHSQDDIKQEVADALADAQSDLEKSTTAIQAKNATTAASKAQVIAGIRAAIDNRLNRTLGGSNTVASEIDHYTVDVVYDEDGAPKATTAKEGTAKYTVTVTYKDHVDGEKNDDHEISYDEKTITLGKLKKVDATGISLDENYAVPLNGKVDITPDFTPDGANSYKVNWKLDTDDKDIDNFYLGDTAGTTELTTEDEAVTVHTTGDARDEIKLTAQLIDKDNDLVIATATTTVKVVKGFEDVQNTNAYYYDAVYALYNNNVVKGTDDSKYSPNKNLTRAEFVQMLYNAAVQTYREGDATDSENPADVKVTDTFSDVSRGSWYAKAVSWAVKNNITAGKTATTFDPNGTVTRAEAVQFLYNYLANGQNYNATATTAFTDVSATAWYANAVNWAVRHGITAGKTSTTFAPKDTTNRAQAAVFLYNAGLY